MRFHHVSRAVNDLDRTLAFYAALGCELEKRVPPDAAGVERAVLRVPGSDARLQFVRRAGVAAAVDADDWAEHVAFHTDDLAASLAAVVAAGATVEREPYRPRPGGSLVAFVLDVDGRRLELVEPA